MGQETMNENASEIEIFVKSSNGWVDISRTPFETKEET